MDRLIAEALNPYENLHMRMNDMEERVNNRLRELSIVDLSRFTAELKLERAKIIELQK